MSRLDVANLLDVPLGRLTLLAYKLPAQRKYTRFLIHRHGGGRPREIQAPVKPLKDVQRRLASKLLDWYEPPAGVHGFVRGRSAVSNARVHQKQEWVLRVDIEDFFPSINFGRVFGLFRAYPFQYPRTVASLLAQICCVENQLPQGAPTSPIISNFICRRLDSELARLARSERCYYSRYADDLCFSTRRGEFPEALAFVDDAGTPQPGQAVERLVTDNGFSLQEVKTRLVWRAQRQRVTGLVVNRGANVDRRYVRNLRNLLYIWGRYGAEAAETSFARANPRLNWPPGKRLPNFAEVIQGRIQHVGHVKGWSDSVYRDLAQAMQRIDPAFAPTTLRELRAPLRVKVYTEGETDAMHLQAAKAYFDGLGEFQNLDLEFPQESGARGSSPLWRIVRLSR